MNCAQTIEAVFRGQMVQTVPFALKGWRIAQCRMERVLRNEGLGIIDGRSVYACHSPNTMTQVLRYSEDGATFERTTIETSAGVLTSLRKQVATEKTEDTSWLVEPLFKGPEDYDKLEAMVKDRHYTASYDGYFKAQQQMEGEAFLKTSAPGAPIHTIMYSFMGLEAFSIEWAERRDRVIHLHHVMCESERPIFEIIVESPALAVQCGGNYSPQVLGKPMFVEYVLPHWQEVGDILHSGGKMFGCHLDANNRLWAEEVGASCLDWIEAFSPSPDTDMTVAEARQMWAGKVLFVNFPSSVHLESPEVIEATTKQILKEAAPGDRFIIGVTENVPEDRWRESFMTILKTVKEFGRIPIERNLL